MFILMFTPILGEDDPISDGLKPPTTWTCDSKDLDLLLSELPLDADGQLSFFQLMSLVFPKEMRTSPFRFG